MTKGICCDCKKPTLPTKTYKLAFMVVKSLWEQYGAGKDWLCINYFEKRLGRKIANTEFINCKLNRDCEHVKN